VGKLTQWKAQTRENEAGLEERNIEGLAVERNQTLETSERSGELVQHGFFFRVVPHEELTDDEAIVLEVAEPYEESAGAGTTGESGGLGVEKDRARQIELQAVDSASQNGESRGWNDSQPGKTHSAMPVIEGEPLLDLIERASFVLDAPPFQDFVE
jgi:hypothetical protein